MTCSLLALKTECKVRVLVNLDSNGVEMTLDKRKIIWLEFSTLW